MLVRRIFKIAARAYGTTCGTAEIAIYNLANESSGSNIGANDLIREFNQIWLQGGYVHGHFPKLARGTERCGWLSPAPWLCRSAMAMAELLVPPWINHARTATPNAL